MTLDDTAADIETVLLPIGDYHTDGALGEGGDDGSMVVEHLETAVDTGKVKLGGLAFEHGGVGFGNNHFHDDEAN